MAQERLPEKTYLDRAMAHLKEEREVYQRFLLRLGQTPLVALRDRLEEWTRPIDWENLSTVQKYDIEWYWDWPVESEEVPDFPGVLEKFRTEDLLAGKHFDQLVEKVIRKCGFFWTLRMLSNYAHYLLKDGERLRPSFPSKLMQMYF